MTAPPEDLRSMLPLLERPRHEAALDDEQARRLVAYGATAWSDWWASKALDWVDEGVWSEDVVAALRRTAEDKTYSQATRHRAWQQVQSRLNQEHWHAVGLAYEGQGLFVSGVSVWDPAWRSEKRSINITHPQSPLQVHRAWVYALPDAEPPLRLAIAEVSMNVYAFAVSPPTAEVVRR